MGLRSATAGLGSCINILKKNEMWTNLLCKFFSEREAKGSNLLVRGERGEEGGRREEGKREWKMNEEKRERRDGDGHCTYEKEPQVHFSVTKCEAKCPCAEVSHLRDGFGGPEAEYASSLNEVKMRSVVSICFIMFSTNRHYDPKWTSTTGREEGEAV